MKKFIRNLLSGYFLVILLLLIELAIIVVVQFFLDDILTAVIGSEQISSDEIRLIIAFSYMGLRVIAFIVAFFIFFRIVNKPEDPEFKIPWIVGMLLLPLFTSIIFLIFGNHGLRKKDKKIMKAFNKACDEHFELSKQDQKKYENKLDNALGTFNYIHNTTKIVSEKRTFHFF